MDDSIDIVIDDEQMNGRKDYNPVASKVQLFYFINLSLPLSGDICIIGI